MGKASFLTMTVLALAAAGCSGSDGPGDGGGLDGGLDAGPAGRPLVTISANPATADVGVPVDFTANISGGTPPYVICTWRFEVGGSDVAGNISGSSCTGQNSYSSAGAKTVTVSVIDSANKIGVNASNGGPSLSISVGADGGSGQADLIVSGVTLINPPAQNRYAAGATIAFSFVVRNVGGGSAAASTAEAKMKNVFSTDEVVLGQVPVGALGPGEQATVNGSGSVPAGQGDGSYDLIVTVDSADVIAEGSEANNTSKLVGGFGVGLEADGG